MTGLVDRPVLGNGATGGVLIGGLGVGVAIGNPSGCGWRLVIPGQGPAGLRGGLKGVVGQVVRVDGGNYAVLVAVEDDQGNAVDGTCARLRAMVHGREC